MISPTWKIPEIFGFFSPSKKLPVPFGGPRGGFLLDQIVFFVCDKANHNKEPNPCWIEFLRYGFKEGNEETCEDLPSQRNLSMSYGHDYMTRHT